MMKQYYFIFLCLGNLVPKNDRRKEIIIKSSILCKTQFNQNALRYEIHGAHTKCHIFENNFPSVVRGFFFFLKYF